MRDPAHVSVHRSHSSAVDDESRTPNTKLREYSPFNSLESIFILVHSAEMYY